MNCLALLIFIGWLLWACGCFDCPARRDQRATREEDHD